MDLGETRGGQPVYTYKDSQGSHIESMIPFNSDIKFNLNIRDMNPSVKSATTKKDNITVYMKGAPERILTRCTKILIDGVEEDFDED